MKMIIDIPEEMWERVKDGYVPLGISKYLKNGTPIEDIGEFSDGYHTFNSLYRQRMFLFAALVIHTIMKIIIIAYLIVKSLNGVNIGMDTRTQM